MGMSSGSNGSYGRGFTAAKKNRANYSGARHTAGLSGSSSALYSGGSRKKGKSYRQFLFPALMLVCAAVLALFAILFLRNLGNPKNLSSGYNITASTKQRQRVDAGAAEKTAYFTDSLGWITDAKDRKTLEQGLEVFYRETGLQPYLYLTDTMDGKALLKHEFADAATLAEKADAYAKSLYGSLFTDEAHVLLALVYYDDGEYCNYTLGYYGGLYSLSLMDSEAVSILKDYVNAYYADFTAYPSDEEAKLFGDAFIDAAHRIMNGRAIGGRALAYLIGMSLAFVLLLLVLALWLCARGKRAKAEKTARDEAAQNAMLSFAGRTTKTAPAPAKPAEKPAEKPVAVNPAEKPAEVKPAEKPAEVKPVEKPAEVKPADKPAETKPADNPSAEA